MEGLNPFKVICSIWINMLLVEMKKIRIKLDRVSDIVETVHTSLFACEAVELILLNSQVPSSMMS